MAKAHHVMKAEALHINQFMVYIIKYFEKRRNRYVRRNQRRSS